MTLFAHPRTVIHGADQSGMFSERPATANDGHVFYAYDIRVLFVYDSGLQTWFRVDGETQYDASQNYLSDLFRGDAIDNQYALTNGSDAQAVNPVIDVDDEGGVVNGVTGNAGSGYAADGSQLTAAATYLSPEDGTIVFTCRFKIDDITTVAFFVGLTDLVTLEEPFSLSGTTYTSNATDACGFLFDTAATTDTIRCVGVSGGTDATHVDTSTAPVNATYLDLAIVVDTDGIAKFYLNEAIVATLTGAVAADSDLTPVICATARTTASRTWTSSRLGCHQDG